MQVDVDTVELKERLLELGHLRAYAQLSLADRKDKELRDIAIHLYRVLFQHLNRVFNLFSDEELKEEVKKILKEIEDVE